MQLEFLRPADAPKGTGRLHDMLISLLSTSAYDKLHILVAFAKEGPLLRLEHHLLNWRKMGGTAAAVIGVDHHVTTKQALKQGLVVFDEVFVTHNPARNCTFHPKLYLFQGGNDAVCIVGSNNLTVGGLETNYECSLAVSFSLPTEQSEWDQALRCFQDLLPAKCPNTLPLTNDLIAKLQTDGLLASEASVARPGTSRSGPIPRASGFPMSPPKAPSALPKIKRTPARKKRPSSVVTPAPPVANAEALLIQITPHHNGEIFLSKRALNENPSFFGFPFTGLTTPKKAGNPAYPQREPDPSASLFIFGKADKLIHSEHIQNLNMVYYTKKSDVRITIKPSVAKMIGPFSVLVMSRGGSDVDYVLEVFLPESPTYETYAAACTTTLPSGGKEKSRKMGWI